MSQPAPVTPAEAGRISALMIEYEAISTCLREECESLTLQHPHQWAGMNSDQRLMIADTLPELLAKLRPRENDQRTVAVLYLDPAPPEMILFAGYCSKRKPILKANVTLPRPSVEGQIDVLVYTGVPAISRPLPRKFPSV